MDVSTTGDVCGLVSLSPLRLSMISSLISSLGRGSILYLSAPSYSVGPLVVSSRSLFLPFSSFRGVCNIGTSGALVWVRGIFPWPRCFDDVG